MKTGTEEVEAKLHKNSSPQKRSRPVLIKKNVSLSAVYRLEEIGTLTGGIIIDKGSLRYYPEADLASHIIGYIGKINRKEYEENKHRGWLFHDSIGRIGIERTFNDRLMGVPGGQQVEVDARGQKLRILSEKEPIIGEDIHLTLDAGFQDRVLELIDENQNVAVCVIDVTNGDILSLISTPTFDPNVFINPNKSHQRTEILTDKRHPTINRSISLLYSPGSIFKVLVALAALEEGLIDHNTSYYCDGEYQMNARSRPFRCWKEEGHGDVNLEKGIEQSCNIYFYRAGLRLGNEKNRTVLTYVWPRRKSGAWTSICKTRTGS